MPIHLITFHGKFWRGFLFLCSVGELRRVLSPSESPLPSWEMQLGLGWNLALGQGQFYNKKENRFLRVLFSPAILGILPPEQLNFNGWPNFKTPRLANPIIWITPTSVTKGRSVRFPTDLAPADRSHLGQHPLLFVSCFCLFNFPALATITRVSRRLKV